MKNLIPFLLLLIFACKKPADTSAAIQISDMPFKTGDNWSYAVLGDLAIQPDTAVYQIMSVNQVNADTTVYNTQTSIRGTVVDLGTITKTSSTVTYRGNNGRQTFAGSGMFDNWMLSFPINSQSTWSAGGGGVKVVSAGQHLIVGGNSYSNVTILCRTTTSPAGILIDTMYIAPQIGILQWDGFPIVSYHLQ